MNEVKDITIKVMDIEGNQKEVLETDWSKSLGALYLEEAAKSGSPEKLYNQIIQAVKTGIVDQALPYGQKLMEIDQDKVRSTVAKGILLSENGENEEAIALYIDFKKKYGDNPTILANLAKALREEGKIDASREVLWESLKLDPNQENAIRWYTETTSGTQRFYNAYLLERIVRLENAWLAKLYLAKEKSRKNLKEEAVEIYRDLLNSVLPVNKTILASRIGSDMTSSGLVDEFEELLLTNYNPTEHGLGSGLLLIKSLVNKRKYAEVETLLTKLYAQKNKVWLPSLLKIEDDLRQVRVDLDIKNPEKEQTDMVLIERPLWEDQAPIRDKDEEVCPLIVLGSLALDPAKQTKEDIKLIKEASDIIKRYTLLLGDYLQVETNADCRVLIPWIQNEGEGTLIVKENTRFRLPTGALQPEEYNEAFDIIRSKDKEGVERGKNKPDNGYILDIHLGVFRNPMELYVCLYKEKNWVVLRRAKFVILPEQPMLEAPDIIKKILGYVEKYTLIEFQDPPEWYKPHKTPDLETYSKSLQTLKELSLATSPQLRGLKSYNAMRVVKMLEDQFRASNKSHLSKLIVKRGLAEIEKRRPEITELLPQSLFVGD